MNGTSHDYFNLPESDRADMSFFIEQIRTVLPVLGLDFLRERPSLSTSSTQQSDTLSENLPIFVTEVSKFGIKARAQEIDGEFVVLADSLARAEWRGTDNNYQSLHEQLCDDGVLVLTDNGLRRFSTDYAFSSPSAASAVVTGRTSNGRREWKVEGTNQTYSEWQDHQVSVAAVAENDVANDFFEPRNSDC